MVLSFNTRSIDRWYGWLPCLKTLCDKFECCGPREDVKRMISSQIGSRITSASGRSDRNQRDRSARDHDLGGREDKDKVTSTSGMSYDTTPRPSDMPTNDIELG